MAKPASRTYSRYSREAAKLMGLAVRRGRIERRLTIEELAARADVSRGLIQRIERGEMSCAVGAVFEVAAIVGIHLFDVDQRTLTGMVSEAERALTLLPQSARVSAKGVKDDF